LVNAARDAVAEQLARSPIREALRERELVELHGGVADAIREVDQRDARVRAKVLPYARVSASPREI
jgi:hypothetical protein